MLDSGNDSNRRPSGRLNTRGLERHTPNGHARMTANRKAALDAVLDEQDRQKARKEVDEGKIEQVYHQVTAECIMHANSMGQRDEFASRKYNSGQRDEFESRKYNKRYLKRSVMKHPAADQHNQIVPVPYKRQNQMVMSDQSFTTLYTHRA